MKDRKEAAFDILMFLPMLVVVIALFYLPDSIPAHYGDGFSVNRWGSKYETLIYGVIPVIFGEIMKMIMQSDTKESNKKVRTYGGIIGLVVFNIIIIGLIYNAFRLTSATSKLIAINLLQIVLVTLGISLVLLGNIIPKTKMNKSTGIRCTGKIQDEKSWNVSQRIGGMSMIIAGMIIILSNLIFRNNDAVILFTLILMILVIPTTMFIHKIATKK